MAVDLTKEELEMISSALQEMVYRARSYGKPDEPIKALMQKIEKAAQSEPK